MAKTLIEFSGGVDSTWVLHDILTNTSDEVVCIHYDHSMATEELQNRVSPDLQSVYLHPHQTQQCKKIIKWCCDNIRSVSMVIEGLGHMVDGDTTTEYYSRRSGKYANENGFDRVVTGRGTRRTDIPWALTDVSHSGVDGDLKSLADQNFNSQIDEGKTITYNFRYFGTNSVVKRIKDLPSDLYDLTVKCVNPRPSESDGSFQDCHECHKEAFRAYAVHAVDSGLTTANDFPSWFVSDFDDDIEDGPVTHSFPFYRKYANGHVGSANIRLKKWGLVGNFLRRATNHGSLPEGHRFLDSQWSYNANTDINTIFKSSRGSVHLQANTSHPVAKYEYHMSDFIVE